MKNSTFTSTLKWSETASYKTYWNKGLSPGLNEDKEYMSNDECIPWERRNDKLRPKNPVLREEKREEVEEEEEGVEEEEEEEEGKQRISSVDWFWANHFFFLALW